MSFFSQKFKAAVEECGVPIADLAEQSGLSVSMLYKIQSGTRMVDSLDSLERLMDAMVCAIPQRKELVQAYKVERIGVNRYACFRELINLVSDTGRIFPSIRELTAPKQLNLPSVIYDSKNVNSAIEMLINREALREDGGIDLIVPLNHTYTLECISQALCGCAPGFRGVCQLFCMKASGTDEATLSNMTAIRSMIPRMLNLDRYFIRYGYVSEPDDEVTPLPYFIITSDGVLLMDSALNNAVFLDEPEICEVYRRSFQRVAQNFKPVLRTGSGSLRDYIELHQRVTDGFKKHPVPISMAAQPCILPCMSLPSIMKYYPSEYGQNDDIKDGIAAFFSVSSHGGYTTFFTLEGLHLLIETGQIMEMVGPQVPRFRREDILDALEEMIRRAKQGNVIPYIFRPGVFKSFSRMSFGLYGNKLVVGCEIPSRNKVFIDINEATLARVVKDYTENALLLGDVFTPEETIRVLEQEVHRFRMEANETATLP